MARPLKAGKGFGFQVYDPVIGISDAWAEVTEGGRIYVAAGTFETYKLAYRVAKKTGRETFVVFATKTLPRLVIRQDFPDGTSSQLENVSRGQGRWTSTKRLKCPDTCCVGQKGGTANLDCAARQLPGSSG